MYFYFLYNINPNALLVGNAETTAPNQSFRTIGKQSLYILTASKEVITHWDVVGAKDRRVTVQVFTLESVGNDRLVLHTDQVIESGRA